MWRWRGIARHTAVEWQPLDAAVNTCPAEKTGVRLNYSQASCSSAAFSCHLPPFLLTATHGHVMARGDPPGQAETRSRSLRHRVT
jgi:hypothetical protein